MIDPDAPALCSETDLVMWRVLKKALRQALVDRSVEIDDSEVTLMTRFMMEYVEEKGYRVVPVKPTKVMQIAIRHALDEGKRMSVNWVQNRTKQRWRYQAALDAAPRWQRGYEHEKVVSGA